MFKKALIVFIVLGSLAFFELFFFERQTIAAIHLLVAGVIIAFTFIHLVYDKSAKIKARFTMEIFLLFLAVGLSMIGAFVFHEQKFMVTLLAQRIIYLLLFYFLLHQLKPDPKFLTRLMVILGIIWAVLYLIQWFAFPTQLFGSYMFKDRNTIRIFLPGVTFAVVAYYILLTIYLKTTNNKYLFLLLLLIIVFVLMGTRQLIGPVVLISMIILMRSKRIHSKMVITILGMASIVPLYLIFQDIFTAMFEVTKEQSVSISENVRVRAMGFYLYRFAPSNLSFFTGNGAYSAHSSYGIMMDNYSKAFGYYLADIGIIGEFILYGIIFVFAELVILFRMAFFKYTSEFEYIRYVTYSLFFSLFVSEGVFGASDGIAMMCILLYMTDFSRALKEKDISEPVQPKVTATMMKESDQLTV